MPGSAYWCVTVVDDEKVVGVVPSPKSHWNWTPEPPVTLASKVTVPPTTAGAGGGGVLSTNGGPAAITQAKLSLSALTPSLAVATTVNVPPAVGVPLIAPVCGSTARPGGSPLAPYTMLSPFGSVAESCRLAGVPAWPDCPPGFARSGTTAVLGFAAMATFAILATEGVPAELNANRR